MIDVTALGVASASCPQCKATFERRHASQKYCTRKCKWTFINRNRDLKPNVFGTCIVCEAKFERYVEPSRVAAGLATNEYCSRKCKGVALSRERHPMWKGGRIEEADGYVMIHTPDHPFANNKGYVFEHRLVMEAHLERYLTEEEVVHHENEIRSDNRLENLKLFADNAEHKKYHESQRERNQLGQYIERN